MSTRALATYGVGAGVWCLLGASDVRADQWEAPETREYASPTGKHRLKVIPNQDWWKPPAKRKAERRCKGILYKIRDGDRKEVWSRQLINDLIPVRAYVTDSGRYVVTMDEWHGVGKLPVVIYGPSGNLIKTHDIDSLGLGDDIEHIDRTVSSYWWNQDAIIFFGPKEEKLFVRLHWGKTLIIDLQSGGVHTADKPDSRGGSRTALLGYAKKKTRGIALSLLDSNDAHERSTGALICGQLKIRQAIPRLKELLSDSRYHVEHSGFGPYRNVYYVRKRAAEALQGMGVEVREVILEKKQWRYDPPRR